MTKILLIAGHGENRDGSFDPGATGIISKGEHRYYEQDFFPAVKKYLPTGSNVVIYSAHNVYDYKDLVTLAKKYGNDTVVVEMHYDAGASSASGGHVIVHADYAPDSYDLAIRDVIKKHIGIRYNHKGHQGISGRADLGNCNRAKAGGINYRLVELGFGTNTKDASVMVNNIDAIAKDFVQALVGRVNGTPVPAPTKPVVTPKPAVTPKPVSKSIDELVKETLAGKHGNGDARKNSLGSNYGAVMAKINGKAPVASKPASKSIDELVKETHAGKHGNGEARKKSLGGNYNAVMAKINGTSVSKPTSKSIDTLVKETHAGKHGNGDARKKSLGSNYNAVMAKINGTSVSKPTSKSIDTLVKETLAGKHGNGEARKKSLGGNYNAVMAKINGK